MFDYIIAGAGSAGCVLVCGNTNAPTIMITEKAADMLAPRK